MEQRNKWKIAWMPAMRHSKPPSKRHSWISVISTGTCDSHKNHSGVWINYRPLISNGPTPFSMYFDSSLEFGYRRRPCTGRFTVFHGKLPLVVCRLVPIWHLHTRVAIDKPQLAIDCYFVRRQWCIVCYVGSSVLWFLLSISKTIMGTRTRIWLKRVLFCNMLNSKCLVYGENGNWTKFVRKGGAYPAPTTIRIFKLMTLYNTSTSVWLKCASSPNTFSI